MKLSINSNQKTIIAGVCGILFCALLWFVLIPWQIPMREKGFLSPRFFPKVMTGTLFCMCLGLLLEHIWKKSPENRTIRTVFDLRALILLGLITLYLFAMNIFGYLLSTFCAVPVFLLFFGVRRKATIILLTAALPLCLYLVFTKLLNCFLPTGWIFG